MSAVRYEHATRTYEGSDVAAVDDLNLDVGDGELIVLVGPSGSGKTTALRMLAGLEPLDAGAVHIGDQDVTNVRPRDRDIAMVFQNYALYPQLTVAENMGFALKQHGVPKEERMARVRETARILDLEPYLDRKPRQLSGGQRQRVAMGRAIVREPAVYLMDEPLSNLDAKLRVQTRTEVVELQTRLGVTMVYVTHDQVEAMTMGDRVAVLKEGMLQQVGAPGRLYHEPSNLFVAGFIGSPAMNLVALGDGRPLRIGDAELVVDGQATAPLANGSGDITVGFRPEAVRVVGDGPLRAQIRTVEDLGPEVFVHVAVDHRENSLSLVSKMTPPFSGALGESVGLELVGTAHFFGGDGSRIASTRASLR
jgi:multiple sugar transport system ATP-binding protein